MVRYKLKETGSRKYQLTLYSSNYSATSNNMKLVHWPLMGQLLHLVQRGGDWAGPKHVIA